MSDLASDLPAMEALIERLEGTGSYRVLRKFEPQERYGECEGEATSVAFLDVETTGVEADDVPIEIGVVRVAYDAATGAMGKVLERYSGLEDPMRPIPENITALTGITDAEIKGKSVDRVLLKGIIQRSSVIVAHNAEFDRKMGEKLFPFLAKRPWGCSMADVPWRAAGVGSNKLEYIAASRRIFYGAHRALEDAEVTAAVVSKPLLEGISAFRWVLEQARADWYRIWATDAPFESKNTLKAAGYTWCDGVSTEHKAWRCLTKDPVGEMDFLAKDVYGYRGTALLQELGRNDRFSERFKTQEWVSMAR